MSDRRRLPRLEWHLPITLEAGSQRARGVSTEVSAGGLRVQARLSVAVGARVRGRLALPGGEELGFEALVRWAQVPDGRDDTARGALLGLEFLGPPDERYYAFLRDGWNDRIAAAGSGRPPLERGDAGANAAASPKRRRSTPRKPSPAKRPTLGKLKAGLKGHWLAIAGGEGWSGGAPEGEAPRLSLPLAAEFIEHAAVRALATVLPKSYQSTGEQLALTLAPAVPIPVGATVLTTAELVERAPGGDWVAFEVSIAMGGQRLASARHVRALVRP